MKSLEPAIYERKNNLLFEQNLYFSDTLKKHTTYTSRVICIKTL